MHLKEGEERLNSGGYRHDWSQKKCQIKYERQHQESKETHLEDWMSNDNVVDAVFVVHCCVHCNLQPVENEGAQAKD